MLAHLLASTALVGVAAVPGGPSLAQDATWIGNGAASGSWNTGTNWDNGVPLDIATFNASPPTNTVTFSAATTIDTIQFNGPTAYTFNLSGQTLEITAAAAGPGIVNNSGVAQTFNTSGLLQFSNSATAGNATINNTPGTTTFAGTSTAGTATITNSGGGTTTFTDSSIAGSATITTNAGSTTQFLVFSNGDNARFIANAGGTVDFSGTAGLNADNIISAGSIEGAGTYNLGANQLTVGGNNLSTALSGTVNNGGSSGGIGASLIKIGTGTLTLSGAFNYTGGTSLNDGALVIAGAGTLSPGGITVGAATLDLGGTTQTTNAMSLIGGTVSNGTLNSTTYDLFGGTVSATLTGGAVTVGSGTTILSGTNTYAGGTTLSGGTLQVTNNSSISNGAVTFDGGTLQAGANGLAFNNAFAINVTGGTVDTNGNSLTISGAIADGNGPGELIKNGAGTLTLSGTNSYTGPTTISAGTLRVEGGDAIEDNSRVNVNGGTFNVGTSETIGTLAGTGGTVNIDAGRTLFTTGGDTTYAGTFSGGGSLDVEGAGTLTLTGTGAGNTIGGNLTLCNCATGGVDISGGALSVGGTINVFASTLKVTNGGTLTQANAGSGIGIDDATVEVTGPGSTMTIAGQTFVGGANAATMTISAGGVVNSNNGAVIDAGAGTSTVTVTGTDSTWNVTGGIQVGQFGTASLTIANGGHVAVTGGIDTLTINAGSTLNLGTGGTAGTLSTSQITMNGPNAQIVANFTDTMTLAATIIDGGPGAEGSLTKNGSGTLILTSDTNNWAGGTTVNAGTLQIGNGGNTGFISGNIALNNNSVFAINRAALSSDITLDGNITGTGSLQHNGGGTTVLTGAGNNWSGGTTISAGTLQIGDGSVNGSIGGGAIVNNSMLAFNNPGLLDVNGAISGTGELQQIGTGTTRLNSTNTYTGATTVSAGTLEGSVANAFGVNSAVTVNSPGTLDFRGGDTAIGSLAGDGTVTNSGESLRTLTVGGNNQSTIFSGIITQTGAGLSSTALVKVGTSTLALFGNNTYTGGTAINGGTLSVGSNANLGAAGGGLSFDGGTLFYRAGFAMNRTVTLNAGGGTFDMNGAIAQQQGQITGTGQMTVTNGGTLILQNATNNYSGGTLVSGSSILVTQNTAAGTGLVTLNNGEFGAGANNLLVANNFAINTAGGTVNDFGFTLTLSGVIANGNGTTGALTKIGAGAVNLAGLNTYTGATNVNGGTLRTVVVNALSGQTALTVAAGATFSLNDLDQRVGSLAGAGTVNLGTGNLTTGGNNTSTTFSGVIQGGGGLTKTGTGILALSGNNTYGGNTILQQGTLSLQHNNALGIGGTLIMQGSVTDYGDGVTMANPIQLASNTSQFQVLTGTGTQAGVISETGGPRPLEKIGAGTLILTANNTYTGTTTITGGTLRMGIANALSSQTAVVANATFDLDGLDQTIASLAGTGTVRFGAGRLTVGGNDASTTYSGTIGGTGGLTKVGTGTLTLNITNVGGYGGATNIDAGRLELVNQLLLLSGRVTVAGGASLGLSGTKVFGSLAGGGNIEMNGVNNGLFGGDNTTDAVFSGVISGTGTLVKQGTGTQTLSGANIYTGPTNIIQGTLRMGAAGALPSATGVAVSNNATFDLNNFNQTIGSLAGGATSAVTLGTATLTTGGNNTTTTFSGVISGTGGLTKVGTGALNLAGLNTYTGATNVNAGTLRTNVVNALSNQTALTVALNATFSLNDLDQRVGSLAGAGTVNLGTGNLTAGGNNTSTTFSGLIQGGGGLVKTGTGNFTLSGNNTYTGNTILQQGTLTIAHNNALGTGTLITQGSVVNYVNGVTMANPIQLDSNTSQFQVLTGTGTQAGVISETGGSRPLEKIGDGVLILSAQNTYTGTTTITGGGLRMGIANALSSQTAVIANGSFDLDGFDQTVASLAGSGTVRLGAGRLTVGGNNLDSIYSGVIQGTTGGLTKVGTGTLTLTAGIFGLSYDGTTNIDSGTLRLAAILGIQLLDGTVTIASGAALQIEAANNAFTGALAGGGSVVLNSNNASLTVGGDNGSNTFSGVISGAGSFSKIGSGTQTLSNNNTYTGLTGIGDGGPAGTLRLGMADALPTQTAVSIRNATLDLAGFNQTIASLTGNANSAVTLGTATLTVGGNFFNPFSGVISGTGGLTKVSAGTLTLSGHNTYTGATNINGGTLLMGVANALSNQTAVTVAGGATFDLANFSQDIGSLAGAGLVNLGTGNLTTGGNNTSTLFSGVIQGGGGLTKTGTGNFTLSGNNTYSGGTTINAGVLEAAADNNLGAATGALNFGGGAFRYLASFDLAATRAITLNAGGGTLDTNGFNSTIAQAIGGAGGLTKIGAGALTLAATSSYSGATTVNAGALVVTGSIANSAVTVNAGATLAGTGTVGSTTINGGNLSPGLSVGTINVAGSLVMSAAAAYIVEVNPAAADRTNVAGTANLAGTMQLLVAAGTYTVNQQYVLLHADGGRSGTFTTGDIASLFGAAIRARIDYTANDVILNLAPNSITPFLPAGASQNATNVAGAIDQIFQGGNPPPGFLSLFNLTPQGLTNALIQLGGQHATGGAPANFLSMNLFLNAMLDPFVNGRNGGFGAGLGFAPEDAPNPAASAFAMFTKAPPLQPTFEQRWTVWGAAYGGKNRTDGDALIGSNDLSASTAGFAAGADYRVSRDTVLGAAVAIGETRWNVAGLGKGNADVAQIGGYASTRWQNFYLSGAVAAAWYRSATDRTLNIAGTDRLEADFDVTSFGARFEGGRRFGNANYGVTPYAAIQVQSLRTPDYSERATAGSNQFALTYAAQTVTDTRSELGFWGDTRTLMADGKQLTLRARAAWVHDFNPGSRVNAAFQTLPGAGFTVDGAAAPRNAALVSTAGELKLPSGVTLIGKLDGEFASRSHTIAGTGTLRYAW